MSDYTELRGMLTEALEALKVAAPDFDPERIEPPSRDSHHGLDGNTVLWWHLLPTPGVSRRPGSAPVGVLTLADDADKLGCVYVTQAGLNGIEFWPDITALAPDEARRLGHALLAAARDADLAATQKVTALRRKARA